MLAFCRSRTTQQHDLQALLLGGLIIRVGYGLEAMHGFHMGTLIVWDARRHMKALLVPYRLLKRGCQDKLAAQGVKSHFKSGCWKAKVVPGLGLVNAPPEQRSWRAGSRVQQDTISDRRFAMRLVWRLG